jgi:hypothetical protein
LNVIFAVRVMSSKLTGDGAVGAATRGGFTSPAAYERAAGGCDCCADAPTDATTSTQITMADSAFFITVKGSYILRATIVKKQASPSPNRSGENY